MSPIVRSVASRISKSRQLIARSAVSPTSGAIGLQSGGFSLRLKSPPGLPHSIGACSQVCDSSVFPKFVPMAQNLLNFRLGRFVPTCVSHALLQKCQLVFLQWRTGHSANGPFCNRAFSHAMGLRSQLGSFCDRSSQVRAPLH